MSPNIGLEFLILIFLLVILVLPSCDGFALRTAFNRLHALSLSSSSSSTSTSSSDLIQVVVLHGYHSNARSIGMYLSNIVDELGDCANFTFLDAPHPSLESLLSKSTRRSKKKFSWASPLGGYGDALKLLARTNQELKGGVDVCIGHSQGGCMLAAILAQEQHQEIFPSLKLSIFLSAFYPLREDNDSLLEANSLHIWGSDDMVVDPAYSEDLKSRFNEPRYYIRQGGGHDPPRCDESTKAMAAAIRSIKQSVDVFV